jgi:hypothetical protein
MIFSFFFLRFENNFIQTTESGQSLWEGIMILHMINNLLRGHQNDISYALREHQTTLIQPIKKGHTLKLKCDTTLHCNMMFKLLYTKAAILKKLFLIIFPATQVSIQSPNTVQYW